MNLSFTLVSLLALAGAASARAPKMPDNCPDLDAQIRKMKGSSTPALVLNVFLDRRKELKCPGEPPSAAPSTAVSDACRQVDDQIRRPPSNLSGAPAPTRGELLEHRKRLGCPGHPPAAHVSPEPPKRAEPTAEEKAEAERKAAEAKAAKEAKERKEREEACKQVEAQIADPKTSTYDRLLLSERRGRLGCRQKENETEKGESPREKLEKKKKKSTSAILSRRALQTYS